MIFVNKKEMKSREKHYERRCNLNFIHIDHILNILASGGSRTHNKSIYMCCCYYLNYIIIIIKIKFNSNFINKALIKINLYYMKF